ncbi:hypothetical protein LBMAG39_00230 [Cyanobium sp.]|nr:hypothetical protein LBMAG39_00230 [Cyanobium sp.]
MLTELPNREPMVLLPRDPSRWIPPEQQLPEGGQPTPIDGRGARWQQRLLPALDLRGANLCRADLRGTDLSACLMDGVDLRLARYDADTRVPDGIDLPRSGAVGPAAVLNGAFLNGADLRGMDLRHVNFMGAYLSGADLSGALLLGVRFVGADLRFAKLQGAVCDAARFTGAQLQQADFRAADLSNAALEGAESIQGADFTGVSGLEAAQLEVLLNRPPAELDCWNPITRQNTRASLQLLLGP